MQIANSPAPVRDSRASAPVLRPDRFPCPASTHHTNAGSAEIRRVSNASGIPGECGVSSNLRAHCAPAVSCRFEYARPAQPRHGFRLLLAMAFLLCAFELPALAQAGNGVVEGKVVNGTNRSLSTGAVELDVVSLREGMSVLKTIKTDTSGRFRIEGLPTGSQMMIRGDYKSVSYHSLVHFDAAGKANVELEVFEPSNSMKEIRVQDVRLAFQLTGERLRSLESYTFENQTRPPRSYIGSDGSFRFSKADGLLEPPGLRVTGPGSSMALIDNALESADGKSYYSLYALRPGPTTFEVDQSYPYSSRSYTLRKTFYNDVASFQIGVIPGDMTLEGEGLRRVRDDVQGNFAVYESGPIQAGTELVWNFSGGTPVAAPTQQADAGRGQIRPMANLVGRNAIVIGPLLLLGLVVVLWYAYSYQRQFTAAGPDPRTKELNERKEQLLNQLASLEHRLENGMIERRNYVRAREQGKKQLRRIEMLLRK